MAVKILHIGDCHLGYTPAWLGPLAARRAEDFLRSFDRIMDIACDPANAIDLVIIPGDLFEHQAPGDRAIGAVRHQFRRLNDACVPIVLLPGNHDSVAYADSVYRRETFPPNVTLVRQTTFGKVAQFDVRGETLHVYSMVSDASEGVAAIDSLHRTDEPGLHIAVLHAAVQLNPTWRIDPKDFPIEPILIAQSDLHYVALGHYHNFREFDEGGVRAVYPGSIEGKDFTESGPRVVVIAEVSEHGVQLEQRECQTRQLRELVVDLAETPAVSDAEIAECLRGQGDDKQLVRVRLTGPADFVPDAEAVRRRLEDAFFSVEVQDETRLVDGALIASLRRENTMRGLFVQKMLEHIESGSAAERETAERALKVGLDAFLRQGGAA